MSDQDSEKLAEGTLISHLLELRDRLVRAVLAVLIVFLPAAFFANDIYELMARPLLNAVPNQAMIATNVTSTFLVPFKMAFYFSLFVAMPVVLYQIWRFVAPGLYRKEKRFAMPLLISAIVLFYTGAAFAYKFVFPLMFKFFAQTSPKGVQMMPDISIYLDFVLTMFFAFGVAFEIPVVVVLLTLSGLVSVKKLTDSRGYVIIGIFIVAAFLTPADALSMVLMAVPMVLLYEAGILFARLVRRDIEARERAAAAGNDTEDANV
jgi:sec-independent protein translocase protein TatC